MKQVTIVHGEFTPWSCFFFVGAAVVYVVSLLLILLIVIARVPILNMKSYFTKISEIEVLTK